MSYTEHVPCPRCDGRNIITTEKSQYVCPKCNGKGEIIVIRSRKK